MAPLRTYKCEPIEMNGWDRLVCAALRCNKTRVSQREYSKSYLMHCLCISGIVV